MNIAYSLSILLLSSALIGCTSLGSQPEQVNVFKETITYPINPLIRTNYQAADHLIKQLHGRLPPQNTTLLVATLVNIDNLEQSSTLGRLASEQIATRFTQAGYRMLELKLRNDIHVSRSEGEMMLSREIRELAKDHSAQAVIVGSYGEGYDSVLINLKVIQPGSNQVLAVHDYAVPVDYDIRRLTGSLGR